MNRLGTGRRGTKDFVLWSENCVHHEISQATADSKFHNEHFHFEMGAEGYSCTQKNCPVWGNPAGMKMVARGMNEEEIKLLHKRVDTDSRIKGYDLVEELHKMKTGDFKKAVVELYEALRKLVDDCPHQMRMNYQQRSKGEAIELLSNLKEAYEEAKKKDE